jgi:3-methyladenine DNA glycosylase AlkD
MPISITFKSIRAAIRSHALYRQPRPMGIFFKTGPGQYGEGDCGLGVSGGVLRKIARNFKGVADKTVEALLRSKIHDERQLGLILLTDQMPKADKKRQKQIAALYLKNRAGVNNWDLVDVSCYKILGPAFGLKILPQLKRWARDPHATLWEKRIAIVTTLYFIRQKNPAQTLTLAKILIREKHDLLQKATGWMLREVGNYCGREVLEKFLKKHYQAIGRTCLRYAIEKFPEGLRQKYLKGKI